MDKCLLCGKPLGEGEDLICNACSEQVRAEALGRKEELRRESEKVSHANPSPPRSTFKSIKEYLEYLKKSK